MNKKYNSFEDLIKDIKNDSLSIMDNEVRIETEETLHEFSKDIADMYPEKTWIDRYERNPNDEDAFENRKNIVSDVYSDGDMINIETYNIAKGEIYDTDKYLDEIIETGEGYQFGDPPPRPVVQMTQSIIDMIAENIIKKGFKNRGWDIK